MTNALVGDKRSSIWITIHIFGAQRILKVAAEYSSGWQFVAFLSFSAFSNAKIRLFLTHLMHSRFYIVYVWHSGRTTNAPIHVLRWAAGAKDEIESIRLSLPCMHIAWEADGGEYKCGKRTSPTTRFPWFPRPQEKNTRMRRSRDTCVFEESATHPGTHTHTIQQNVHHFNEFRRTL